MSQRNSGYPRKPRDDYATPEWVTKALIPHLPARARRVMILEPAAGAGKMVDALRAAGLKVERRERVRWDGTSRSYDFLADTRLADAVVTNPPFGRAFQFIEHALMLTQPRRGFCAFLLRSDKGHAKTQAHLFRDCSAFARKVELLQRIVWFERPGAAPSYNHA
jgi:hypothetical protein